MAGAVLALGLAVVYAFVASRNGRPVCGGTAAPPHPVVNRSAASLGELLEMPPEQLAKVDIAEMNLLCAAGLPGAEKLDIDHCLTTLYQWAARVTFETNRHLYRVTDPRYADHYRHSEAYLRAEMLVQALCEDCGVKYDLASKDNFTFNDSRVAFIHGMIPAPGQSIADAPGGTCASMPVMYVAVGRRLGYPLMLVTTRGHIFARWDGKGHPNPAWRERFNIEGTHGFSSYPDDYYKTWPFKVTDQEVLANGWLVNLTPTEEFAEFLSSRGHCSMDNGQPGFAARCFENSCGYDPTRPCYREWFLRAAMRSGYRPSLPDLVALVAAAQRAASIGGPEKMIARQDEAARQEWLRGRINGISIFPMTNVIGGGAPIQPVAGALQPHSPYAPQPGIPKPYPMPTPGMPPMP